MNKPVIFLNGVEKTFPGLKLGPVSMEVEPGVIVAVVGPNGSGKTTFLHMLMSIVRPERGEARLFGLDCGQAETEIKRQIGYAGELVYADDANWRVGELVQYYSRWYPTWDENRWRQLAERFELDRKQKLKRLSKGTKSRLMFSLALAHNPKLLILDEPSSGLDPSAWRIMVEEIQTFMDQGNRNVIMATHNMEEVRRLADYVAVFSKGKLIEYRVKDEIQEQWKSLWIEQKYGQLAASAPGIVLQEDGPMTRIVTRDAARTEQALREAGIAVARRMALEWDEILELMIAQQNDQRSMQRKEGLE
jgi:ABC-2 type transport system ATP-binding protein